LQALGWYEKKENGRTIKGAPNNSYVTVKLLKGDGMHTWIGMVGYCMKSSEHPDFRNFTIGVSEADIEAGRALHLRLGAGELKYRTALSSRNIFSKALVFWCESLPGILNF
jgi:hypothetical protein